MPVDRVYLTAPKSTHTTEGNLSERLLAAISHIEEPQTKTFWIDLIQEFTKMGNSACLNLFHDFVITRSLVFLRVYQGHAIYVGPSTPMALHNKMPVIGLET